MKPILTAVAIYTVLLITGCATDRTAGQDDQNATEQSSSAPDEQNTTGQSSSCQYVPDINETRDAQQQTLWEAQEIHHYLFDYTYEAYSYQIFFYRYRVKVVDDAVAAVFWLDENGTAAPSSSFGMTLDALFGKRYGWITYDPTYAYVFSYTGDIPCAVDARVEYTVTSFTPIDESNISNEEWMQSLYRQMEAAADTACETDAQCSSAAYGVKACGGPIGYLIYGTEATDTDALASLISRYNGYNTAYNAEINATSDCSVVTAPETVCGSRSHCIVKEETP